MIPIVENMFSDNIYDIPVSGLYEEMQTLRDDYFRLEQERDELLQVLWDLTEADEGDFEDLMTNIKDYLEMKSGENL